MTAFNLYAALPVSMAASALAIGLLRPLARPLKLLDHPNERKHHAGAVPLVGGLAVFAAMLAAMLWPGESWIRSRATCSAPPACWSCWACWTIATT